MKLLEQSVTKGVVRNSVSKSKKLLEIQSLELKLDKDMFMLKLKLELNLILIHNQTVDLDSVDFDATIITVVNIEKAGFWFKEGHNEETVG